MDKAATFLTSGDVAHLLKCSPDDVNELAKKREIRGTREGEIWKFRNADVIAYKLIADIETKIRDYYLSER